MRDLLFTPHGFLFQLLAEPVLVAPLNCENLSPVDCQTYCVLSMSAVGCALLSSLFLRRETPVSHAEGASGTMMFVPFFFTDSSDRLARVIRACCLLSCNGFAIRLLRLHLWAVLRIAMLPPLLQLLHWFSLSLRVSSALVFCLPEFDPLGSVFQVTVVLRHGAVLVLVACTPQARSTI